MTRIRLILLSMLAVLAFSAVAASTASAHRVWSFEGKVLPTGEKKPLKLVKVVKEFQLKAGTETIACKTVELKEGTIENILVGGKGPTGRDKGTVLFKECRNVGKPACVVANVEVLGKETALVENTKAAQEKEGLKIYDLFTPEKWTEEKPAEINKFAVIKQTGTGCVATTSVEGNGVAAEISPEGESATKTLKFPCPPITEVINWKGATVKLTLKAFGVKAEECGEAEIESTGKFDVQ
jgi:hypothetical protein